MMTREEQEIEELQFQVSVLDKQVAELKAEREALNHIREIEQAVDEGGHWEHTYATALGLTHECPVCSGYGLIFVAEDRVNQVGGFVDLCLACDGTGKRGRE